MVSEGEWNNNIELLERFIDNWAYRMTLTDYERDFLQCVMIDLSDILKNAKWNNLQEFLKKEVKNVRKRN